LGTPRPNDPTGPVTTLKTASRNLPEKAGVQGRWHDNRHTLITDLAENGASDQTVYSRLRNKLKPGTHKNCPQSGEI
jgi:hypothetical protein